MDTNMYIWIGVGVVITLMIIIGYFAEQTNFGKKGFKEKTEKARKTKKMEPKESMVSPVEHELKPIPKTLETPSVVDTPRLDPELHIGSEDRNIPLKPYQVEDLNAPLSSDYETEDLNVPLTSFYTPEPEPNVSLEPYAVEEDLSAPLEPYVKEESTYTEPIMDPYYGLEEDLNVPLQDNYNSTWEEPQPEEHETRVGRHAEPLYEDEIFQLEPEAETTESIEPEDINTTDIDLPDISAIQNTEISKEEDDDDIWKF